MAWCPVAKAECWDECAWFAEGQCAFARLHDISDSLEEIRESIDMLENTTNKKNFSE